MRSFKNTTRISLTALLTLVLAACGASLPRIPAQGVIHGQNVDTTVDSRLAKYYLEHYLAGERTQPEWDARLDELHRQLGPKPLTTDQLRTVSRAYSVDTAALFYALQLLEDPENRALQDEFERHVEALENEGPALKNGKAKNYRVIFVPGWLYHSKPWTGADFAKPRAILNRAEIEHHFIYLTNNGPVEDNARWLADDLLPLLQGDKPVIIVSGSKGGPEVAMALGKLLPAEQTRSVKAWLNICGALQGSPLADKWTTWPVSWATNMLFQARGYGGLEGLRSLRVKRSQQRASEVSLPEHIMVVNYIGVPVSGTILDTEFEKRFTYVQLRDHGPNDGLVLIPDEIETAGLTVTEVGKGHFLSYPDFGLRATALLNAVIARLERAATVAEDEPAPEPGDGVPMEAATEPTESVSQ